MQGWEVAVIALAGLWAGLINTVVGSGTLVTFPVLVALGYPPVTATTSNAIGLISGTITGAVGYRRELAGHGRRLAGYAVASFLGAIGGAALLLSLPPDAFETIVPVLVGLSVLLVAVQPLLARRLKDRAGRSGASGPLVYLAVFAVGIYGGYFTAAQGIMLVGLLGLLLSDPLQRLNHLALLGVLDNRVALQRCQQPVLHCLAGADALVPAGAAQALAQLNEQAEVCVLPQASHALPLEAPIWLAGEIGDWLERQ